MFNLSRFKYGQLFKTNKKKRTNEKTKKCFLKIKMLYENNSCLVFSVLPSTGYLQELYWHFSKFLSTKCTLYYDQIYQKIYRFDWISQFILGSLSLLTVNFNYIVRRKCIKGQGYIFPSHSLNNTTFNICDGRNPVFVLCIPKFSQIKHETWEVWHRGFNSSSFCFLEEQQWMDNWIKKEREYSYKNINLVCTL